MLEAAESAPGHLLCAPHILLSPTYRAMHAHVGAGSVGGLLTARARYGWAGPDWSRWFYEPGGGALFDLGVYNVTSLCGFFGPARRVTAMTGVAIPERVIDGEPIRVQAEDNAHVLIDFGDARFAVVTTGFTMQQYRSPCIELYGTHGVLQMLGDDWAPEGYELWRNDRSVWEVHPETRPDVAVDGRAAPPRRVHRDRRGAGHAARARLPRARDHARGAGRGRRRPRARDRDRLPGARPRAARRGRRRRLGAGARPAELAVSLVERPAPPQSSPRPIVRRAGADPARRRDPPRLGRPGGGRGVRLDLRVDGAGAHARLRAGARRRVPPLGGFRTIFAADELLHVLEGVLVIADPETGEVQRAAAGQSVFFRRDTWHHAFALGPEPLRVLELFAPPPAAGASSAYARAQPYLATSRYADDELLGSLAAARAASRSGCRSCATPTSSTAATSACSAACSSARST